MAGKLNLKHSDIKMLYISKKMELRGRLSNVEKKIMPHTKKKHLFSDI